MQTENHELNEIANLKAKHHSAIKETFAKLKGNLFKKRDPAIIASQSTFLNQNSEILKEKKGFKKWGAKRKDKGKRKGTIEYNEESSAHKDYTRALNRNDQYVTNADIISEPSGNFSNYSNDGLMVYSY
jgi:hypothetical protein